MVIHSMHSKMKLVLIVTIVEIHMLIFEVSVFGLNLRSKSFMHYTVLKLHTINDLC